MIDHTVEIATKLSGEFELRIFFGNSLKKGPRVVDVFLERKISLHAVLERYKSRL
jgi:GrpB-like predicted nucleotidyltransferase (UPF0157 family)